MGASCSPKFEAKFFLNGPPFSFVTQFKFINSSEHPPTSYIKMNVMAAVINSSRCVRYLFSGNSSLVLHLNKAGFNFRSAPLVSVGAPWCGRRPLGFSAASICLGDAYFLFRRCLIFFNVKGGTLRSTPCNFYLNKEIAKYD
jgi:hypothetical protein